MKGEWLDRPLLVSCNLDPSSMTSGRTWDTEYTNIFPPKILGTFCWCLFMSSFLWPVCFGCIGRKSIPQSVSGSKRCPQHELASQPGCLSLLFVQLERMEKKNVTGSSNIQIHVRWGVNYRFQRRRLQRELPLCCCDSLSVPDGCWEILGLLTNITTAHINQDNVNIFIVVRFISIWSQHITPAPYRGLKVSSKTHKMFEEMSGTKFDCLRNK